MTSEKSPRFVGIFLLRPKKGRKEEERRKKQGERGRRNLFRDIAGYGSQEGKKPPILLKTS